jgi:hypothetical protein
VDSENCMVLCSEFRAQEIPINCISSVAGTSEALIMDIFKCKLDQLDYMIGKTDKNHNLVCNKLAHSESLM